MTEVKAPVVTRCAAGLHIVTQLVATRDGDDVFMAEECCRLRALTWLDTGERLEFSDEEIKRHQKAGRRTIGDVIALYRPDLL